MRRVPPALPPARRGLLTLALLAASGALAQASPPSGELTLAAALAQLSLAPAWKSADLAYQSAAQSLDAARAAAGLSLSTSASYDLARPEGGNWQGGGTLGANASLTVLPWAPANAQIQSAQRAFARAALDLRDSRNTLALNVAQQYFAAQLAAQDRALAETQLALARRNLEVTQAQLALGQATQESLLAREADEQNAQASLSGAESSLALALRQLGNTLGRDLSGLRLSSAPALPAEPEPLDALLARAAANRSEVLKAQSQLQDAQEALRVARFNRAVPDLSLSLKFGQLGGAQGGGAVLSAGLGLKSGAASLAVSTPLSGSSLPTSTSLGVSGSYAILDPAADADIRSRETAVASAALALQTAQSSVDLDLRQKYQDLQNARAALTGADTALRRAGVALATAQAREAAGLGTALDTLSAQLALAQAQRSLQSAQQNAALAVLRLANASGSFSIRLLGDQP